MGKLLFFCAQTVTKAKYLSATMLYRVKQFFHNITANVPIFKFDFINIIFKISQIEGNTSF